ncbi:cytochrome P450 20A1-like [Liolophura sinensis]|uniref:cytochrome P450 20A1-like n=1 Tax=Liolophura sinensis TaxID=3198878 RepID=UPI003158226A
MEPLLLLAICFVVAMAVVISLVKSRSNRTPSNVTSVQVPGLHPAKGNGDQGNLVDVATAGSLHQFLMVLHKQYGPIAGFWWGKQHVVSVASPTIFKNLVQVFGRPPELFKLLEPLITADSIQFANYEEGRRRRRVHDKAFSHAAISQYYSSFQKLHL